MKKNPIVIIANSSICLKCFYHFSLISLSSIRFTSKMYNHIISKLRRDQAVILGKASISPNTEPHVSI